MTLRNLIAAWRTGTRWPLVLSSLALVLVVAIGICEALGWPFLVGPLENALAGALDRKVSLRSAASESSTRIGLIGSVRVRATSIEIGSPSWSEAPHMLQARGANVKLGYFDLWHAYRGEPLNVKVLQATDLDAHLERDADGRASWQFGRTNEEPTSRRQDQPAAGLPTFDRLAVESGHVAYQDAVLPADIDARFALRDSSGDNAASNKASASSVDPARAAETPEGISVKAGGAASDAASAEAPAVKLAPGETGLRLKATGTYGKLPVRVDLKTAGALSLLAQGEAARAQPVVLEARVGKTEVSFDGSTTDPLHLSALNGKFSVAGPSLATVGELLGVTLPETPEFKTNGKLAKDGQVWSAAVEEARIGSSRLSGDFSYDAGSKPPLLAGKLGGKKLVLADLGPAVGTAPSGAKAVKTKGRGRVIPDKRFDLPSLRTMDADVGVEIDEFDTGTDVLATLRPLRAKLSLKDGVLKITDIDASTAKGRLVGSLQLDGRGDQAKWDAHLGLRGVDLAQWIRIDRSGDAPPYLSGKLDAKIDVAGAGRSTAEILGSLSGEVRAHMRNASVSHLAIEALGVDVAQALGVLLSGDDQLRIQCNIIDLEVKRGMVKPRLLVVNTTDSTLWVDGIVSLKTESMGLKTVVAPKDFSPLSLRTPVHISGTLSDPSVSLEASKLAGKAGAAALLALLHPLAAVLPLVDTGSEDEAKRAGSECASLAARGGKIPAAPPQPQKAPRQQR